MEGRNQMATNTFVELSLTETALLADLTSISYDLERSRDFAERLKATLTVPSPETRLTEPLSIATIVQYCRPFAGGKRQNLNDSLLGVFNIDQRRKHQWFRDVRDKHIAHSVNAFEESHPIARYWLERVEQEGISSIECNHYRVVGLSAVDADTIIELSTLLLAFVAQRLKEEKARVLSLVRQMPIQEVLSGGRRAMPLSDLSRPGKPR
jgi:hypothetical protein